MKQPLIGVTPLWDSERGTTWMEPGYLQSVERAGGIPVVLPLTGDQTALEQLAQTLDGFLYTGGHDISPELYGREQCALCGPSCPERDHMEVLLFEEAVRKTNKPLLGICRGAQIINIVLGGTLYQDIPAQLPCVNPLFHNQQPPYDKPVHKVDIAAGSPLADCFGREQVMVNSFHHQGIRALSPELAPMAASPDGLVEAVWMPGRRFVWAVQWHPECMPDDECSQKLFSAFVTACQAS